MAWLTVAQIKAALGDDAPLDDDLTARLLAAAQAQVEAYAPALPAGAVPPDSYLLALTMQVQELNRSRARDGDVLGFGAGFAVRVRPLDTTVKSLLRPQVAAPKIR